MYWVHSYKARFNHYLYLAGRGAQRCVLEEAFACLPWLNDYTAPSLLSFRLVPEKLSTEEKRLIATNIKNAGVYQRHSLQIVF